MNTLLRITLSSLIVGLAVGGCSRAVEDAATELAEPTPVELPVEELVAEPAAETWDGAGVVFDPHGRELGEYTVELIRRPLEGGAFALDITVLLPDGQSREIHHTMTPGEGNGFVLETDGAGGAGMDLGEGMLTTYTETDEGTAHASTIALDDDRMRIVRYELEGGEAVRIFREVYRLARRG